MSLKDIRSECSDTASLLQPYADNELSEREQELVARHLEHCAPCRSAVSEQMWVRTTLQAVERERAPQELRASILASLDEVDRQATATTPSAGFLSRLGSQVRDLIRGGMIMVPAGAVAAALFFVARQGVESVDVVANGPPATAFAPATAPKNDEDVMRALGEVEPKVDFPVQVATPQGPGVQLVGARLDSGDAGNASSPGARLRYQIFKRGRPTGAHLIDRQLSAQHAKLVGTPVVFGGHRYKLERTGEGVPQIHFQRGGVTHTLWLESGQTPTWDSDQPPAQGVPADFAVLLDLAHKMAQGRQLANAGDARAAH